MEVLALIVDGAGQSDYQSRAPLVDVTAELFNQWDDWYHPTDSCFRRQFDEQELAALTRFGDLMDLVASETPQQLPPLHEFMQTEPWRQMQNGARTALLALSEQRTKKPQPG